MRRDPRAYLWDVIQAGEAVQRFVDGTTLAQYRDDLLVRSAVERQLEIAGEAPNQLSRVDQELAARIPEVGAVVGFRNILVHGGTTSSSTTSSIASSRKSEAKPSAAAHSWCPK